MIDPSEEIQTAFVAVLKNDTVVAALVGNGVYDAVPDDAARQEYAGRAWPYISLGQPQILPEKADCIDAADVAFVVHGWCRGPQSVEIKKLGKAIAAALDDVDLTLTGHRAVSCQVEQTIYLDDPDPETKHVAVTVRVVTEPTD